MKRYSEINSLSSEKFKRTVGISKENFQELLEKLIHQLEEQKEIGPMKIPFQAPMHWKSLVDFLQFRAIPGVEHVEDNQYFRTIMYEGKSGWISAKLVAGENFLQVYIAYPDTEKHFLMVEKIKSLFDLNASAKEIQQQLSHHSTIKDVVAQFPGIRIPGSWDPFELTVRAILGQQISVKAATTLAARITKKFGIPITVTDPKPPPSLSFLFPTAEILADADLTNLGITKSRSATIKALACAVCEGDLPYHQISLGYPSTDVSKDNGDFIQQLKQIRGIGDWTANYVAMRVLREPDAFPASDLVLRKMAAQNANSPLNTKQMLEKAESWRPWRAYATMYLWKKASLI